MRLQHQVGKTLGREAAKLGHGVVRLAAEYFDLDLNVGVEPDQVLLKRIELEL